MNLIDNYFKKISLIFLGLLMGQVLFTSVAFYLVNIKLISASISQDFVTVAAVTLLALASSYFIPKTLFFNKISAAASEKKIQLHLSGSIIRFAMLELPCLLSNVYLIITNNKLFGYWAIGMLVIFTLVRPKRISIENDLNL